ncbi:ammonium transporter [Denitrovibrio acetiphilus DSM 12809]|uniref:Ammonium transporter n=1 Tax=Denitrovibrio acetiphilus (strain DSM 12809 / NBRC 114555 / N2460) TaxID=522772 RepID=D4H5F9_DENA2|nr:ammonium transporter [Denitrovibrio acetiphilus]ADD67579.1 ammonium transporter [Denitrovibrio acetiphilus DSM 12809]
MDAVYSNIMWVLVCSFLVALMQAGFACLETGFVRSKNNVNVAVKNLVDFCISASLFTLIGYGLMFGDSFFGIVGEFSYISISKTSIEEITFYVFQLMFAGTAATIISGAVAERMKFSGYIIVTIFMSVLIYPICGHWAWAIDSSGSLTGWLGKFGFMDFAGSTVVHSVAGWCALAAVIIIGPRLGRFGRNGRAIDGQNLPIAVLGVFLLWVGFFGFNGGSTLAINDNVPIIIANTTLAGAAGGISAMFFSWYKYGMPKVEHIINGVVAGLVAICAGCNLFNELAGFAVGFVAGILCVMAMLYLEKRLIDDVIGAVPAHLVAGVWGTLSIALFAPVTSFSVASGRFEQFGIQLVGVAAIGFYSFNVMYFVIMGLKKWVKFRVTEDDERIGLNISEHGSSTSLLDLISQMDMQARSGDFSKYVDIEPETEAGHIATFYNSVLEKFHIESMRRQTAMDELYKLANYDSLTSLINRRYFYDITEKAIYRTKRNRKKLALLFLDLDGFKRVNDTLGHEAGDELLVQVAERGLETIRESDVFGRVGGDEFCIVVENVESERDMANLARKIIKKISATYSLKAAKANIGVSIGIAVYDGFTGQDMTPDELVKRADKAMYTIKTGAKGSFSFYSEESGT